MSFWGPHHTSLYTWAQVSSRSTLQVLGGLLLLKRPKKHVCLWGSDLELCCQGVAGPLQGGGVQALLVAFQAVPVLRLLHCFVHILENFPALVPGPAELLVLRGAACPWGNEGFLGLLPDESARA